MNFTLVLFRFFNQFTWNCSWKCRNRFYLFLFLETLLRIEALCFPLVSRVEKKKLHSMHSQCFPWHKSCLKLRLRAILSLKGNNRVPAAPDKYNCQFLLLFHLLLSECYQQDLCLCRMWGCVNLEILLNLTQHSDTLCFLTTPGVRQVDLAKVEWTNISRETREGNYTPKKTPILLLSPS